MLLTLLMFSQLAGSCRPNDAVQTLASVAKVESGLETLAIHDNATGATVIGADEGDATRIAEGLISRGHSVDLGLMQINSANLPALGMSVADAFNGCQSIAAAGRILDADYAGGETHAQQQAALRQAISRYNTGNPVSGFANGYVHRVEYAARGVPALDVGVSAGDLPKIPKPAALSVPTDPNAPPAWDVWSSFDYASTHHPAPIVVSADAGSAAPSVSASPPSSEARAHD